MKVFNKFLIFTLILSAFTGCKDENLPVEGIAGTYKGKVSIMSQELPQDVPITITNKSANNIDLSVSGSIFGLTGNITAQCNVTSSKSSYSFSGTGSLDNLDEIPDLSLFGIDIPEGLIPSLSILVENNSSIDASGKAIINMGLMVTIPDSTTQPVTITIKFEGQKQ
jgi:hypothetical protein